MHFYHFFFHFFSTRILQEIAMGPTFTRMVFPGTVEGRSSDGTTLSAMRNVKIQN